MAPINQWVVIRSFFSKEVDADVFFKVKIYARHPMPENALDAKEHARAIRQLGVEPKHSGCR